ncbi:Flp family type IVb pilin [candidate division KSB1 bacterium]|nr:Flp family type IVb pilin [candidate division KSB1 bacterium]
MLSLMKRFLKDEEGATMTEYIILVVLIAIAAIVVVTQFGDEIKRLFTKSTGELKKL